MTEKEKMLAGELYNAGDGLLVDERADAKEVCREYNMLRPRQVAERRALLEQLLYQTGSVFLIEPAFWCDYGYNITLGENFASNHNLVILDCAPVVFGDNVMCGPNCSFFTAGHPLDVERRNAGLEFAYPITVGDNVWFGGNVCVMPGVTVGDNSMIGAGSVVTKDIPGGVLAVGNPCRVVRRLGDEERERYT